MPCVEYLDANSPRNIAADFESGRIFAWKNPGLTHLSFFQGIESSAKDELHKKIKSRFIFVDLATIPYEKTFLRVLAHNQEEARLLQARMIETEAQIRRLIYHNFPPYTFLGENNTWRFTPNKGEPAHWDYYAVLHPQVRVFTNLDDEPRVWRVGPHLFDYVREHGKELGTSPTDTVNQIAEKASYHFVRTNGSAERVEFAPGTVWVLQSQLVLHEIVYGKRMHSMSMEIHPNSLCDSTGTPLGLAQKLQSIIHSLS